MLALKFGRVSSGIKPAVLRCCFRELNTVFGPQMAMDNSYWPNSSAIERAKDVAANLALPKVVEAEWILTEEDLKCLTTGAGILASGGGGDPKEGFKRAMKVLYEDHKEIKLVNPCRLDAEKMGMACTVFLMGDPMKKGGKGSLLALERLQQVIASGGMYGASKDPNFPSYVASEEDLKNVDVEKVQLTNKITALTAVETGGLNTIEPLLVSAESGLPCLDAAGQGRSYPQLQMFMPFIYGSKYCPAVLADTNSTVTCVAADSCKDLEDFFRNETDKISGLPSIAFGVMNFETVLLKMNLFATSRAWQLGRAVKRAMDAQESFLDAIINQQQGFVLLTGTVTNVETKNEGGFTINSTTIEGAGEYHGNVVKITALNENIIAEKMDSVGSKVEKTLATTPDLITVVNLEAGKPLDVPVMAGSDAVKGKKVAVVILPTDPRLYTKEALKVVGPRALDFDMDYQEPQFL